MTYDEKNINDPRHPDFDLRTATPDPRYEVSNVIVRSGDIQQDMGYLRMLADALRDCLIEEYPDETMDMFALVVEQTGGYRVVVGFGFSHNPLDNEGKSA